MAVLAPIPRARVSTAITVNPGDLRIVPSPYRASSRNLSSPRRPLKSRFVSFTNSTFPNSRRVACSASLASTPRSTRSCAAISRWLRNSSSSSASRFLRCQKLTGHLYVSLLVALPLLFRLQHASDCVRKLRPFGSLSCELPLAGRRQLVILCSLFVVGNLPFRPDPLLLFQPVQRWIERAGIHLQNLSGTIADRHANPISVLRSPLQRLQNQQVQRPLQ